MVKERLNNETFVIVKKQGKDTGAANTTAVKTAKNGNDG